MLFDQQLGLLVLGREVDAQLLCLEPDVGVTGLVGDEDPLFVSDQRRVDVLVGEGVLGDGAGVDAALVGERALTHVRAVLVRYPVCHIVHEPGDLLEPGQLLVGDALDVHLYLQVGDNRAEIGVAAPLPVAVEGSLDLIDPHLNRKEGICHGKAVVVVAVDAQRQADRFPDAADDLPDLPGHHPAVRIAQHDAVGARARGRR